MEMLNTRIDITRDLDGRIVVLACFDVGDEELVASAHAIRAVSVERFRTASMSADDVVELRELTALADELAQISLEVGIRTVVLPPARLGAYRDALARFVESRDAADWIREEDREPLGRVRSLVLPLEELCGEAMRGALSPGAGERS
jgi:hypothetical protein